MAISAINGILYISKSKLISLIVFSIGVIIVLIMPENYSKCLYPFFLL